MAQAPLLLLWPCLALSLTILAMNALCDALRDAVDPRHASPPPRPRAARPLLPGLAAAGRARRRGARCAGMTIEIETPAAPSIRSGRLAAGPSRRDLGGRRRKRLRQIADRPRPHGPVAVRRADRGRRRLARMGRTCSGSMSRRCAAARRTMAMVFQDPLSSLNPCIASAPDCEAIRAHRGLTARAARAQAQRCCAASASPTRSGALVRFRTSCRAACASAR
jgi:peptide/nickel transport system permease protein